ncbi:hypothetical protein BJ944DRAFT_124524 [Cunninghamella echinulata]|nr:hypothetical protein BJ944DRAFT_124524 [Cunninghamella echinulata]
MSLPFSVGIITVSDTSYEDNSKDKSGPLLKELVSSSSSPTNESLYSVTQQIILPDEKDQIETTVKNWSDVNKLEVIILTGGTGFAERDVTPDTVEPLLTRLTPGITHLLLSTSLNKTPFAALSRLVTGFRDKTLIVTLPGSPKACRENMDALLPILPHALQLVRNQRGAVQKTHSQLQSNDIAATTATSPIPAPPIGTHTCIHHHHHHHRHDNKQRETRTLDINTPVSHRARTSPFPMITVEEAHHIISQYALPLDIIEKPLSSDLIGYVLAEDVQAKESVPAYRASIVDGYAVHAEDGPGIYPVVYVSVAKSQHTEGQPFVLKRGEIARVATGGMVPEGANAVVMVEDTKLIETTQDGKEELKVEILVESKEQGMIRPIGSDCKKGDVVCKKGTLITAIGGELGILASVGITHVKVHRKPKIGVLSSGNEVKDIHGQQQDSVSLLPGEIRDSNRLSLLAALQQQGMEVIDLGIVKDDIDSMESSLKQALSKVDVIISTGGVSMGEADYMKPLLEQKLNATIHFGRVHMKPALRKMAAFEQYKNVVLPVKLTHDVYLDPRPEYHRVRVYVNNGSLEATSTGNQQSSRMISMLSANGLLKLPKKTNDIIALKKGESVSCLILGSLYQM